MSNKVVVVGGGAAGLVAAITASRQGAYTVLLEKNDRVGKKILSTGNGRCNFTNIDAKVSDYSTDFVFHALEKFSAKSIIDFFADIGVLPKIEDEGRVYPLSSQATSILDVLRFEAERVGVFIKTGFSVKRADKIENGFSVCLETGENIICDKLIIATGGMAAPKTGSTGDGYSLLKLFGHSVSSLKPALCHLPTDKGLHGVRQHAKVTLNSEHSQTGEIQFNKDNLSGIPVFNLSAYAKIGDKISIDFLPEYTLTQVKEIIHKRPVQSMETFLVGILNKNLSHYFLKDIGIVPLSRMSDTLTASELDVISVSLKNWEMTVTGTAQWDKAQVTRGGIVTSEVDPETMESRFCPRLYIAGEILDVDSRCGGYNLQWAWASGMLAGSEAGKCTE